MRDQRFPILKGFLTNPCTWENMNTSTSPDMGQIEGTVYFSSKKNEWNIYRQNVSSLRIQNIFGI